MSGVNQAQFAYTQDSMGRTTNIAKTGTVFSRYGNGTEGLKSTYGYNDRSEVTSDVTRKGTTTTVLNGRDDAYTYDQLGNRKTATHNSNVATYTTNTLNQYTERTVPGVFDVAGAAAIAATVTVNGSNTGVSRVGQYFFKGHALTNSPNAAYTTLAVSDGTTTTNLPAFVAATPEPFTYDFDGNLLSDGRWSYIYDAENRLIWTETAASAVAAGHPKVACHMFYDYLGRRVFKYHYVWSGGTWSYTGAQERFIYNGWNLIAELDGSLAITKNFFWGLDLSGTAQGAGGVGGLLFTQSAGNTLYPIYDALGNVHGMIKAADGSLAAAYEYDASGNTLRESGPLASSNPFRYSTKYTDLETSLVYYGYRYYSPSLGRFINKDPIAEMGGINLYSFCGNNGVNSYDMLGQHEVVENGDGTFTIVVNNYTDAGDNFSYYTGFGQKWVDTMLLELMMAGGPGIESFDDIGGARGAAAIMGGGGGASSPNPVFAQDLLMQSDIMTGNIIDPSHYNGPGNARVNLDRKERITIHPTEFLDGDTLSEVKPYTPTQISPYTTVPASAHRAAWDARQDWNQSHSTNFTPTANQANQLEALLFYKVVAEVGADVLTAFIGPSGGAKVVSKSLAAAESKVLVIGENMKKVIPYAEKIGAEIYPGMPGYNSGLKAEALLDNGLYIEKAKQLGYRIIDIGPDFARRAAEGIISEGYQLERFLTKDYAGYEKAFKR